MHFISYCKLNQRESNISFWIDGEFTVEFYLNLRFQFISFYWITPPELQWAKYRWKVMWVLIWSLLQVGTTLGVGRPVIQYCSQSFGTSLFYSTQLLPSSSFHWSTSFVLTVRMCKCWWQHSHASSRFLYPHLVKLAYFAPLKPGNLLEGIYDVLVSKSILHTYKK